MSTETNAAKTGPFKKERYCWVVLLMVALASFFTFFHRASSGVIRADMTEAFHMSATSFATFSSMYFYPYMCMQLPVGLLADSWGPRKTISLGCVIAAAGTLVFSAAQTFPIACLGRVLVGVGVSTPVVCTQKIAATWFPESRAASAAAYAGVVGNFGGLCAQAPLALLVGILGWRMTFHSIALVALLFAAVCFLLLRDRPEQIGLSDPNPQLARRADPANPKQPVLQVVRRLFSSRRSLLLLCIMPLQMGINTMFSGTWGVSYLCEVYGYSSLEASGFTTWLMAGMIVAYSAVPILSDRMKNRKIPLVATSAMTLLVWAAVAYGSAALENRFSMIAAMLLMGATSAAFPVLFCLIREYNDPAYVGTSIGAYNAIGMATGAVFPIICGKLIDGGAAAGLAGAGLYRHAFTFAVVLAAAAFAASVFTVETHCKNISGALAQERPEP